MSGKEDDRIPAIDKMFKALCAIGVTARGWKRKVLHHVYDPSVYYYHGEGNDNHCHVNAVVREHRDRDDRLTGRLGIVIQSSMYRDVSTTAFYEKVAGGGVNMASVQVALRRMVVTTEEAMVTRNEALRAAEEAREERLREEEAYRVEQAAEQRRLTDLLSKARDARDHIVRVLCLRPGILLVYGTHGEARLRFEVPRAHFAGPPSGLDETIPQVREDVAYTMPVFEGIGEFVLRLAAYYDLFQVTYNEFDINPYADRIYAAAAELLAAPGIPYLPALRLRQAVRDLCRKGSYDFYSGPGQDPTRRALENLRGD